MADETQPDDGEKSIRRRRTYTREYKLRIVREAEVAKREGTLGALLRRENLYSSILVAWRREFPLDGEVSLAPVRRGPKPRFAPDQKAYKKLQRECERASKKLLLIEVLLKLPKGFKDQEETETQRKERMVGVVDSASKEGLPVGPTCAAVGIPRTFYYRCKKQQARPKSEEDQ
jgi:transposase-like protein